MSALVAGSDLTDSNSPDGKLIADWDSKLRACQSARLKFERQWHYNMAFFFGRQWLSIVSTAANGGFSLQENAPKDKWRVRHTANRILRIVRTELTKLSKEEPQFFCVPKSTELSDRLAAMAGESIADYIIRTKYFNSKRTMTTFWALMCGTSYLKNYYNPNKTDDDGLPGRIDFDPVTAFHLFVPNLQETEMERQPWVIHAMTMNPEDVYEQFDVELEAGTDSSQLVTDQRYLMSLGINDTKNKTTSQCYVKEVFVKPNKKFPNGASFIYGEGKLLWMSEELPEQEIPESPVGQLSLFEPENTELEDNDDDNVVELFPSSGQNAVYPYPHGRFPFAKVDHIPTGMWYGDSVIKHLISSQKEYNRTRSLMLENRNVAGKPQYSYTKGAFNPRQFNSRPGLLLPVNMGFEPPKPIEQPPLPQEVMAELEATLRDMDDISSQSEITKGRTPPGVEAASAIAYLSEENDTILHHTVTSLENAVQETGIQVLSNVHSFWPVDRVVRSTSKNQITEAREFKKTDLNPLTDFRVQSGSMAPKSEAAKQAFIVELMDRGLPLEKGLQYLQMNETAKLYEDLMLDIRHAQRENIMMANGEKLAKQEMGPMGLPVPRTEVNRDEMGSPIIDPQTQQPSVHEVTINPYDAHEIHIQEHEAFQKTQEYEFLDLMTQQIIQDHVDEHKMEMLKERNALQVSQIQSEQQQEVVNPRELAQGQ